eukprot:1142679-Pelagomonas_calceolata.AAC.7
MRGPRKAACTIQPQRPTGQSAVTGGRHIGESKERQDPWAPEPHVKPAGEHFGQSAVTGGRQQGAGT